MNLREEIIKNLDTLSEDALEGSSTKSSAPIST